MITSKQQKNRTVQQINQLREQLKDPAAGEPYPKNVVDALRKQIREDLDELISRVDEYEQAMHFDLSTFDLNADLDIFWKLPIICRLSQGKSVSEFAGLLGVDEKQVRRWESIEYSNCSVSRFKDILAELEAHKYLSVSK